MAKIEFTGPAKRIEDWDLPRIGRKIGVGEDEVHSVMDVESSGSGFDSRGRLKMLFEPHVFWSQLGPGPKRDRAARAGLAYPNWGTKPYPKDSYPRLIEAMKIDETAALKSASWGLGQVMGFNHRLVGYDSVQAMIADFVLDEDNHLEAMVQFIVGKRLDGFIRRHEWDKFAHGYNGAGYARNGYHTKLAARYHYWQGKPDTPWQPGWGDDDKPGQEDHSYDEEAEAEEQEEVSYSEEEIRSVQQSLKDIGYREAGNVDGKWGSRSVAAASAFQHDRGLDVNGILDEMLLDEIREAQREGFSRPIPPERSQGVPENSTIVQNSNKGIVATIVAAVTGFFTQFGDYIEPIQKIADSQLVRPFRMLVVENFGLILMLLGGAALYFFWKNRKARIEMHQKGELA